MSMRAWVLQAADSAAPNTGEQAGLAMNERRSSTARQSDLVRGQRRLAFVAGRVRGSFALVLSSCAGEIGWERMYMCVG